MDILKKYRVKPGSKVDLSKWDPADTGKFRSKDEVAEATAGNVQRMADLQYLLYAEDKRALLIVLQGMDAGGKDGVIRHVLGPLNPQGCAVTSFKVPTAEELAHDFLWRIHRAAPPKGMIGVFNRSHYEDVLVVRVHNMVPKSVWSRRYEQINAFERTLAEGGVHLLKFYLHISPEEQLSRLKSRISDPRKHWKINPADFEERKLWGRYQSAYEAALSKCSTKIAPWFVVPADRKWYRDLVVSQIVADSLESLGMKFPEPVCDISTLKVQ